MKTNFMKASIYKFMIIFLTIFLSAFLGLSCTTKVYSEIDYNKLFLTGQIDNVSITCFENIPVSLAWLDQ